MDAMTTWRSLALVTLAVLFTVPVPVPARHMSAVQTQLDVPDPADCTLPSLSEVEIRALIPTPSSSPEVIQLPTALPAGEPVDEATETAIRETISNFYACANAGMPVETIALVSQRFLSQPGTRVEPNFSVTVTPVPDQERIAIFAIWNIHRLVDDRVTATVALGGTESAAPKRTLVIVLVREHDRWLIDELVTAILRDDQHVMVADIAGSPPATTPDH